MNRRTAGQWTSWCRSVTAEPRMVAHPESVEELVQLVTSASQAGRPVKAVGAGHSFNQIAATDGVQVCLDQLIGLTSVDHDSGWSPSAAAPRLLSSMSCWLPKVSLENLGDIDQQTIAGAISTGTHGTGARVRRSRKLRPAARDHHRRWFSSCAARQLNIPTSLPPHDRSGCARVITEMTLQCVPSFNLHASEGPAPLDEVLDSFDVMVAENDHSISTGSRTPNVQ